MAGHDATLGAITFETLGLNPGKNYDDVTTIEMKQLDVKFLCSKYIQANLQDQVHY